MVGTIFALGIAGFQSGVGVPVAEGTSLLCMSIARVNLW